MKLRLREKIYSIKVSIFLSNAALENSFLQMILTYQVINIIPIRVQHIQIISESINAISILLNDEKKISGMSLILILVN